jgi:hypothetical protein
MLAAVLCSGNYFSIWLHLPFCSCHYLENFNQGLTATGFPVGICCHTTANIASA